MLIRDILSDRNLIETALKTAMHWRSLTDARAVPGAALELEICKAHNAGCQTHKLLTQELVKTLSDKFSFDLGPAGSLRELDKMTKQNFGLFSAADLFLFENQGGKLILVDALSLKSSMTAANKSTSVFLHNDATGEIHDALCSGNLPPTICNVAMFVSRGADYRVFHFDGDFSKFSRMKLHKTRKHGDADYGLPGGPTLYTTVNRNATTRGKPTSFNRGIQVVSKKTRNQGPFDCFEALVREGIFSRLAEGEVSNSTILEHIVHELRLTPS